MRRVEAEYDGWGAGSVVAMLCIFILLICLPLGMGPGPVQPPSFSMLLVVPVLMAAVLIFLSHASRSGH
ncbi:hypothetical protein CDL12_08676 [Handroanthus impetiginosus]|uniref:Transmembrane protein n=1 Tax=Handroanthus impetiginosus TaxID=429701 RepID=A0A2G9HMB0_9LAMI|nr:hypothetical protein CDL12_08676 [Handroanthus impetiginosus]